MTEDITQQESGLSRRTIVKGAAWSIPVMAAAVAAPAAVASPGAAWDVQVTANCENDYDITALETLLDNLSNNPLYQTLLPITLQTVKTVLAGLGITEGASRTFTITALEGTVPAGTQFTLAYPDGLIDATLLSGLIEANALLNVVTVNNTTAVFTLDAPLTQGASVELDYINAILDIGALSSVTLSLVGADNPTSPGGEGSDTATLNTTVGAAVDLGGIGVPPIVIIPGILEVVIDGNLAVQVCG